MIRLTEKQLSELSFDLEEAEDEDYNSSRAMLVK